MTLSQSAKATAAIQAPIRDVSPFTRLIVLAGALTRPKTLGVRGLIVDQIQRVFLVRHTYVPGFYLPGGGVDGGETLEQAMRRELKEEGNIVLSAPPSLFGVYLNRRVSSRDHVALYVIRDFAQSAPREPDYEIAEAGFFPLDALPDTTTEATRARIREALHGEAPSPYW